MRLERIKRIKDHGLFYDFSWPQGLPDFEDFNLIYGWNGSGKTTFANLLRHIEKRRAISTGTIEVVVDSSPINGSLFAENISLPQVRVFNRDFVEENVFTSHGSVTPIFFLGEESIEKQKRIENLRAQDMAIQVDLEKKEKDRRKSEKDLDNFCIDRAASIKDLLRSSGSNPYNNYVTVRRTPSCG